MRKVTGRCLCEAVAYEIEGDFGTAYNCHCSKCRRWHGAPFRARASVAASQFKWLSGQEHLTYFQSSDKVTKSFCSICGSNLISTYEDMPDVIGIALGPLEQHPGVEPSAHIFTAFKSPWFRIIDDLPQYPTWPGDESAVRETRA